MGVYIYKSRPSDVAKARVKLANGQQEVVEVALYEYAYKPYGGWHSDDAKLNRRMHVSSGAFACAGAWKRSGRKIPKYGILFGDRTIYADAIHPFLTCGHATVHDDYVRRSDVEVLEWVELPKGVRANLPSGVRFTAPPVPGEIQP